MFEICLFEIRLRVPPTRIAHNDQVCLFAQLFLERLEDVAGQHRIPVIEITEDEGHVHQRQGIGETGQVGRRDDRIVDGNALGQKVHIVGLDPQFAVQAQVELDFFAGVFIRQLGELHQGLGIGVVLVEQACPTQGCLRDTCGRGNTSDRGNEACGLRDLERRFHQAHVFLLQGLE